MTITATDSSSSSPPPWTPSPLCPAVKALEHEEEEEEEESSVSKMMITPFEWLTNYSSLSHLLCRRFLFPQDDFDDDDDDVDHDDDEDKECVRSTTTITMTKRRRRRRRRKVLHIGCGSSTIGESLLLEQSSYDEVVNVDTDGEVLERMCRRWEMLLFSPQNANEQNCDNSNDNNAKNNWGGFTSNSRNADNEREGDMEVRKMVFDSNRQAKALSETMEDLQSRQDRRYHRQEHHCSDGEVVAAEEKKDNRDGEGDVIINTPKETTITMDDGGSMKWLQLNFKNESICFMENDNHGHHHGGGNGGGGGYYPPGYFDLVLDKSTLDCALCSGEAAVGLLCEVYRALNPIGGVYFCVSFHHVNFILPLLRDCPGVQWEVQHYVVKREVDIPESIKRRAVKTDACCRKGHDTTRQQEIKEEKPIQRGQLHGVDDNLAGCSNVTSNDIASTAAIAAEPPMPVWASGSFEPNDEYGKTVNVFICRRYDSINNNNTASEAAPEDEEESLFEERSRRESEMENSSIIKNGRYVLKRPVVRSAAAAAAGSERTRNKYELDRITVRKHVHHINDLWYQTHNPMVTHKREEELRRHFYETLRAFYGGGPMGEKETSNDDERGEPFSGPFRVAVQEKAETKRRQNAVKKDEISNEKERVLPLEMCYDVLFTDAEREHLTYEYFLQDWNAFLENRRSHFPRVEKDGMTFDIALEFLKEMQ